MHARIVGEFRVERGGENVALPQTDHMPVHFRLDSGFRANMRDIRPADEHERQVVDVAERADRLEAAQLPAVRVAMHDRIKLAEVDVVIVVEFAGEQDHARACSEHRLACVDMLFDRFKQSGRMQQLGVRGAFPAGQDHAADGVVEILGRPE